MTTTSTTGRNAKRRRLAWHGRLAPRSVLRNASQGRLGPACHGRDARGTHGQDARATTAPSVPAFTLIELILVMAVIASVLAMSAPVLRGFFASRQAADTAAHMLALTRWARSHAVTRGQPCRLIIDSQAGQYWLAVQEGSAYVVMEGELARRFHLPEGVSVAVETAAYQGAGQADRGASLLSAAMQGGVFGASGSSADSGLWTGQDAANLPFIQFYPNGRCDLAAIDIRDRDGVLWRVTNPSPAEFFHIVPPVEESR